ncbi:PopZ family protein [Methylobrevis albus]|nr:DUF2497 domain-containing protein [Methylobrevis albus]
MEEILASIRRIIADDGPAPTAAPAPAPKAAAPERPAPPPAAPVAAKAPPPPPPPADEDDTVSEDDLDRLFASAGNDTEDTADDVLELTEEFAVTDDDLGIVEGFDPDLADVAFADPDPFAEAEPDEMLAPEPEDDFAAMAVEEEEDEPAPLPPPLPPRQARPAEPAGDRLLSPEVDASIQAAFGSLTTTLLASHPRTIEDLVADMLRPMLKAWLDENLPGLVDRMVRAEIERITRAR